MPSIAIYQAQQKPDELLEQFKHVLLTFEVPDFVSEQWVLKYYVLPTEIGYELLPKSLAKMEWMTKAKFEAPDSFQNTDPNITNAFRISTRFFKDRIAIRHINYVVKNVKDENGEIQNFVESKRIHYKLYQLTPWTTLETLARRLFDFILAKSL